jgi:hypothetical protein
MLSLLAKLGLDISPFTRGLSGAKDAVAKAGADLSKTTGQQTGELLKSWIGLGAVIGFAARQFDKVGEARDKAALSGSSASDELARAAVLERVGDAASVSADEFERLVKVAKQGLPSDNALAELAESAALVKANLSGLESALVRLLGAGLKGVRGAGTLLVALKEGAQAFINVPLSDEEENANSFSVARGRFQNARRSFANRLKLDEALFAAEAEQRRITPGTGVVPEKDVKKTKEPKAVSLLGATDPRPSAGGLASAGLFFGGAGNPLLREATRQTDLAKQSVAELKRVRDAIVNEL